MTDEEMDEDVQNFSWNYNQIYFNTILHIRKV